MIASLPERGRAQGLPERDRTASGPGPQRRAAAIFRRRMDNPLTRLCRAEMSDHSGFASRNKIAAARRPPLRSGRCRQGSAVQARSARRRVIAGRPRWARPIHPRSIIMATDRDISDIEDPNASSPTDRVLTELQMHGYRPFQDEPDLRPLPEARAICGAVADIFDALISTLAETRLEPDLENLLWSTVNLFHRATDRVHHELDDNEVAQRRSQKEQDGSEVRSVELERLVAEGVTLIERRNCMEFFRDQAADLFEHHTGSSWRPRSGSMVNHRALTAAMIDSRDFLAAKRRAETEVLLPAGPKIAFTGGLDFNDHRTIWTKLDQVHAKHPDMVLLHGGSPKGAERIAACWANSRKVTQIVFKPDWTRDARAAPFKRNDRILDVLPIGVIAFPGSGISANLADKAKKLGIPVWKLVEDGA
jgi:YspA, cpYpsA-related SLOG family